PCALSLVPLCCGTANGHDYSFSVHRTHGLALDGGSRSRVATFPFRVAGDKPRPAGAGDEMADDRVGSRRGDLVAIALPEAARERRGEIRVLAAIQTKSIRKIHPLVGLSLLGQFG